MARDPIPVLPALYFPPGIMVQFVFQMGIYMYPRQSMLAGPEELSILLSPD